MNMDATGYSEFLDDTEQDVSEFHSKLLEAVSQLDKGQRVKKAERSEPTLEVSEFHLVKSGVSDKDTVQVQDLAKALGKKGHHLDITKSLQSTKRKIRVLPKPLEKPAADRIKRIVGFENATQELKKWNAVITRNRTAGSLQFPLNKTSIQSEPTTQFVKRFRIQSELEKELAALEPLKENIEQKDDEFSLTLNEIVMKRKEAARIRAQQSYKEAKARRQNKIKSKKFHRVQRKEKIKLQLKEFEELQKTDPQAALEKLEQLDKTRAEERMSLRHKNTGQWAKSKQVRAKYNKDTRQELALQLSVSRELTQKVQKVSDSEGEDGDDATSMQPLPNDKENPWMGDAKTESEIDNFIQSYRKYWDDAKNQSKNQDVNVSTKSNVKVKQMQVPPTDAEPLSGLKDQSIDDNVNASEINNTEKTPDTNSFNGQKISPNNSKILPIVENGSICNIESPETENDKEDREAIRSNVESKNNNSESKVIKNTKIKNSKKSNKTLKLQKKDISKVTATSSWNVEPVENASIKSVVNSLSTDAPNTEKINKIFEFMEEKIQDQVKSKLERVTQNNNKVKGKRKSKHVEVEEDIFDGLEIQSKRQRPILDSGLNESINENNMELNTELYKVDEDIKYDNTLSRSKVDKAKVEIDPNKYVNIKPKHLNTDLPLDITGGDDVLDNSEDEDERRNIVSEAFADDDVVEEFRKEKEEAVQKSQPKDIDLTLPGWGSWGGKNIKVSKRKKKRFIVKVPKDLPRRDENKGDVIIFEDSNPKLKQHQVNELPYPFTSVKDYEASVRMPIGRNFVPENAHRKLIAPAVKTCMGKIIEPMTEDVLVKKDEKKFQKSIPKRRTKIIRKRKIHHNS